MAVFNRILVPVDGSDPSRRALSIAVELARDGGLLRLVHVIEPSAYITDFPAGAPQLFESVKDSGRRILDEARSTAETAGVQAGHLLLDKGPRLGEAVANAAREWQADLIVVGTHGRHGPSRLVLGSGAEQVLRHAPVPVLSVPVRDSALSRAG